jgi:hypothetical protein
MIRDRPEERVVVPPFDLSKEADHGQIRPDLSPEQIRLLDLPAENDCLDFFGSEIADQFVEFPNPHPVAAVGFLGKKRVRFIFDRTDMDLKSFRAGGFQHLERKSA